MPSALSTAEIAGRASFDAIRYAQLWEDADVLLLGLNTKPGATLVSICSAGDNALAMLTLDPAKIIVVDLSPAQIECLRIRIAAIRLLDHAAFLELMGSRPSGRRALLLDRVASVLPDASQRFWASRRDDVVAYGLGGVGKFERYFRILRRYLMPLVHGRTTIDALLVARPRSERERFLRQRWNTWRWRVLVRVFFSRFIMGRLGRDPAFFDHVEGSLAEHVARRTVHASVDLDPADNPYLHWIFTGTHGAALPLPFRAEHFATIRSRLDRLDIRNCALETFCATGEKADGFNLSDVFEYMSAEAFEAVYGALIGAARPGARLVYWNMMVPRRVMPAFAPRVRRVLDAEARGKAMDKAFFYSDFVVEEVLA
jgi:S-adenosylmethionine-diacylglycerol 3-amino-3-carboxypropyl transferase